MKVKLVYANYDKTTGESVVTIRTKRGEFTGKAKLNSEDADIASNFIGCEYAEVRARIKDLKALKKELDIKVKTMEDFDKRMSARADNEHDSVESRQRRKMIYELKAERKGIQNRINIAEQNLKSCMVKREAEARKNLRAKTIN